MKLASAKIDNTAVLGEVIDDHLIPLKGLHALGPGQTPEQLRSWPRDEDAALPLGSAMLLPVSTQPARVLCVGLNYRDHIEETGRDTPTYPVLFPKYSSSLIGPYDDVVLPPESEEVDYEGELAVVIGRPGRRIPREQAQDYVLGYCVANDITMRDYQYKTHQWIQGKAWDNSTPLGPVLVSPDEFDPSGATIQTLLNGDVVQSSNTGQLLFDVTALIALVSVWTQLEVGDVILTGTPGGVGYRRKPRRLLQAGDTVTVSIEGLGQLKNTVRLEAVGA